ncbi:hypothetical protein [Pararhizobium sp.]|uniref:hypothetical protein n=1 Tax=Pararhizobium sp. TaxID=1977563 RepID=UPI003D12F9D7
MADFSEAQFGQFDHEADLGRTLPCPAVDRGLNNVYQAREALIQLGTPKCVHM